MVSWASVAKKEPPRSGAAPLEAIGQDEPVAVLDANAIIGGLSVQRALDRLVTIPEALQEVRDKQSREALEALPFRVELMEPSEDSVRAGAPAFLPCSCPHVQYTLCCDCSVPYSRLASAAACAAFSIAFSTSCRSQLASVAKWHHCMNSAAIPCASMRT